MWWGFVAELVAAAVVAALLLYRYSDIYRNHLLVSVSVLSAWYFSFLIIFILPLDVSSTVYRQCQQEHNKTLETFLVNAQNSTAAPVEKCIEPYSKVPDDVFPNLWRVVYWSSQCLTWLIMPIMQSYSKAGDFTVKGKFKSALIDNAIYYGSYLFICGILLIYLAVKSEERLDGAKIKTIASTASNTWGLFLLILLLGYALVEVPRSFWNDSKKGYKLTHCYFKAAKLSSEKCEAEESVDDILESLQGIHTSLGPGHILRGYVDTILQRVPVELRSRMERRAPPTAPSAPPSLKSLVRLHKQAIKALHTLQRTETQWTILINKIFHLEDIVTNTRSIDRRFKSTFSESRNSFLRAVYNPTTEWYWECVFRNYFLKFLAVCTGILSVAVVWSEVTFFTQSPVLSLFAIIVNEAKEKYDYFTIEIFSTIIITYLCFCAFSTVLKIKFLNLYYLAPHHQTNEYSLIFSGMMACRLTPPLCLNFLCLIHMDSHIYKKRIMETHYTQIMGHMDVLSIISSGFNIYFPMLVLLLCIATYFSVGSRLLSMCGFQQFIGDDELTSDLVEEGKEIVNREKRKRQRAEDAMMRRRDFQGRFRTNQGDSAHAGLLNDSNPTEYYVTPTYTDQPPSAKGTNGRGRNERSAPRETSYQRADDIFTEQNLSLEDEINERFGASTRPGVPRLSTDFDDVTNRQSSRNFWEDDDDSSHMRVGTKPTSNIPPRNIFDDV